MTTHPARRTLGMRPLLSAPSRQPVTPAAADQDTTVQTGLSISDGHTATALNY